MENASKALIIAGAILISILIIAIGMYIYTSSSSSIYGATSQMNSQEVTAFNQTWTNYEGTQKGSNCRGLISQIIANNSTNKEDPTKLISIKFDGVNGADNVEVTSSDAVEEGITKMQTARNKIEIKHNYWVETEVDTKTGIVNTVIIYYTKP